MFELNRESVVDGITANSLNVRINADSFTEVSPGVWAAMIIRQTTGNTSPNGRVAWLGKRDEQHHYFRDNKRFVAVTWNENYLIFASIGCKTKNQNRRTGIWWRNRADFMRMSWDCELVVKDVLGASHTIRIPRIPAQPGDDPGFRQESPSESGKVDYTIDSNSFKFKYDSKKGPGGEPSKPYKINFFRVRHEVRDEGFVGVRHTSI